MSDLRRVNVPGRVVDFYQGGGAWVDYENALRASRTPVETRELGADELALFTAVDAGRRIKGGKGGYYVIGSPILFFVADIIVKMVTGFALVAAQLLSPQAVADYAGNDF